MMDGAEFQISQKSFQLLEGKQGLIYIPEINSTINLSSVSSIYPKEDRKKIESKEQKTGVLYDGTRVIKKFGEWVDANSAMPDDKGNYQSVKIDPTYYPEVAADCVATEKEWEQIKGGEDYYKIVGYTPRKNKQLTKGGFTHIMSRDND